MTKEIIFKSFSTTAQDTQEVTEKKLLNIIHFNDVYNIDENHIQEPKAGAARFVTLIEQLKKSSGETPTLVLFSGDAISPSSVSMLVKGRQMIEILNECYLDCACLGNHDFDFGLETILTHISNSNFPWLLSNVFDIETKLPLGNVPDKHIINTDNGIKVGIIGLIEEEWMTTLSTISSDEIIYENYVTAGNRLSQELKEKDKCDIVIALTHMRWNNDTVVAAQVAQVDLFLGGHDHDYSAKQIGDKWVVKSGSDFKELSFIQLCLTDEVEKKVQVTSIEKYIVDSTIEPKPSIQAIVNSYMGDLNEELDVILGYMNIELEGRFKYVRTVETNLGNFICDIMMGAIEADCAFLNSGSLRSDCVHPCGDFKVRDLKKILPYLDENIVIKIFGHELLKALENGVSQYPHHEGRFLQVSAIKFAFDPRKLAGSRIDSRLVLIGDELLDLNRKYSLMTKAYLQQGKDGFECLVNCPVLVDSEDIPVLYNLVYNHFKTIASIKEKAPKRFRGSVVPLIKMIGIMHELKNDPDVLPPAQITNMPKLNFYSAASFVNRVKLFSKRNGLTKDEKLLIKKSEKYKSKIEKLEVKSLKLEPKLENRIVCIRDDEHFEELLKNVEQRRKL